MSRLAETTARFVSLFWKTVVGGVGVVVGCGGGYRGGGYWVLGDGVGYRGGGYWVLGAGWWYRYRVLGPGYCTWPGYCPGLATVLAWLLSWLLYCPGLGAVLAWVWYWPGCCTGLGTVLLAWVLGVPAGLTIADVSGPWTTLRTRLITTQAAIVYPQPWRLPRPWK